MDRTSGTVARAELLMQPEGVVSVAIPALIQPRSVEATEIGMWRLVKSYLVSGSVTDVFEVATRFAIANGKL